MEKLNNSFSVTYTHRGIPNYAREAVARQQRRTSWIYGTAVDVP